MPALRSKIQFYLPSRIAQITDLSREISAIKNGGELAVGESKPGAFDTEGCGTALGVLNCAPGNENIWIMVLTER